MTKKTARITPSLKGQSFLVLGAARSGLAVCRLLHRARATVTLVDDRESQQAVADTLGLPDVRVVAAGYKPADLPADALVLSPGIPDTHPLPHHFIKQGLPIYSEVELAGRFTSAPVVAVTGSNGKSTVTTMVHQMLASGGYRSFLGGNIGMPFAGNVLEEYDLKPSSPVHAVEISSFQAEHLDQFKPKVAVFINLAPDHLDRYPDLTSYGNAKLNLARNLSPEDSLVYNYDDPFFRATLENRPGTVPFSTGAAEGSVFVRKGAWILYQGKEFVPVKELSLPGPHNLSNFLGAATAAHLMGVSEKAIARVMRQFTGLPHRLELVAEVAGVRYYNDSKATNVASTRVALASFKKNIILILGGSDKGATDYSDLIDMIRRQVKLLVTYGQVGLRLAEIFQGIVPIQYEDRFEDAVLRAQESASRGNIVLLSPANASFDQFADFEKRGDAFRQIAQFLQSKAIHA